LLRKLLRMRSVFVTGTKAGAQLRTGESRDSGFDAEPAIGPRFARTRWHRPGMTTMVYSRSVFVPTRCSPHNSRALLNENDDTRRVFSSRIKVRVIGGSARWLQFSRSQSRQLTPIGVPSVFSRSIPVA
jgi:hypothetical protein